MVNNNKWLFFGETKELGTKVFDTKEEAEKFAEGKEGKVDGPYNMNEEVVNY